MFKGWSKLGFAIYIIMCLVCGCGLAHCLTAYAKAEAIKGSPVVADQTLYEVHYPHITRAEYLAMLKELGVNLAMTSDKKGRVVHDLPRFIIAPVFTTSAQGAIHEEKYINWITKTGHDLGNVRSAKLLVAIKEGDNLYGPSMHIFQSCGLWNSGNPHIRMMHAYGEDAFARISTLACEREAKDLENENFSSASLSARTLVKVHIHVRKNEDGAWEFQIGDLEYK